MATDDTTACSTLINEELSMSFTTETIYFVFNKLLNILLVEGQYSDFQACKVQTGPEYQAPGPRVLKQG